MRNPRFFQKCCHSRWNQNKVGENDNAFERNEDCATVFLEWTDFSLCMNYNGHLNSFGTEKSQTYNFTKCSRNLHEEKLLHYAFSVMLFSNAKVSECFCKCLNNMSNSLATLGFSLCLDNRMLGQTLCKVDQSCLVSMFLSL